MKAQTSDNNDLQPVARVTRRGARWYLSALLQDSFATVSILWLALLAIGIAADTAGLMGGASRMNLSARNTPPFDLSLSVFQWLGTDALGRSLAQRLLSAASVSLTVALVSVFVALVSGTFLGLLAGYFGGVVSTVVMRISDFIMGFPTLLVALLALYLFGPNISNLIIVLAITRLPSYARVARAETLEARERLYVDASKVLGARSSWILLKHVLPIIAPTMLTLASLNVSMVMLFESGLSYLGLGVQPPAVSWGLMVAQGQAYLSSAWWLAFFPGVMIMLTAMSFSLLSNWFRMAADPSQERHFSKERKKAGVDRG